MVDTIHVFLYDPMFTDTTSIFKPILKDGGVCQLTGPSLSYFNEIYEVRDGRAVRSPALPFTTTTKPNIVFDGKLYSAFKSTLNSASQSSRDSLFSIIDRTCLLYVATETEETLDQVLLADSKYSIYTAGSFKRSPGASAGTAYLADGSTRTLTVPNYVSFNVVFNTNGVIKDYEIKVWTDNNTFYTEYPESSIISVALPLTPSELLTLPLIGTGANTFSVSSATAELSASSLQQAIKDTDASGFVTYRAKIFNNVGDIVTVPFNLLYKGQSPDRLTMRQAIREKLLQSGVGNTTAWKQRIPELFITGQMYLVPQWGNITTQVDRILYPSIMSTRASVENTKKILNHVGSKHIEQYIEHAVSIYDLLLLTAISHPDNETQIHLRSLHPTYQAVKSTDPAYAYMEDHTKSFATQLSVVLAVAAGKATSTDYTSITQGLVTYIPFSVNEIEYYVVTKESYLNIAGSIIG